MAYTKTVWVDDPAGTNPSAPDIDAANLNHIEQGIFDVDAAITALNATEILTRLKTVDGPTSGLDADLLDGLDSTAFLRANGSTTLTGNLALGTGVKLDFFDENGIKEDYYQNLIKRGVLTNTLYDVTQQFYRIYDDADTPGTTTPRLELDTVNNVLKVNGNTVWHGGNALTSLLAIDGSGSGLDADLLDGLDSTAFLRTSSTHLETYIEGLVLQWNTPGTNGNNLAVSAGAAWVPSLGRVLNVPSTLTGPAMSFAASTWYYVYLYDNAGSPALEISTTAPAAPYKGDARTKTGDTSRRYLGAIKTNAAGTPAMLKFRDSGNGVRLWLDSVSGAPLAIVTNDSSTTVQTPSCSGAVPPTSRIAQMYLQATTTIPVWIGAGDLNGTLSNANFTDAVLGSSLHTNWLELSSTQTFQFLNNAAGGGFYARVMGYVEER